MHFGVDLDKLVLQFLKYLKDAPKCDSLDFITEDVSHYLHLGFRETVMEKKIQCFRALITDMMIRQKDIWNTSFSFSRDKIKIIVLFILECYTRELRNKMASFIADLKYPIPLLYTNEATGDLMIQDLDILDQVLKRRSDKKSICVISTLETQNVSKIIMNLFGDMAEEADKYKDPKTFLNYSIDFYSNIEDYYVVNVRGISENDKYKEQVNYFMNKAGFNIIIASDKDFIFNGQKMFSDELSYILDPFKNGTISNPNFKFCLISEALPNSQPAYSKLRKTNSILKNIFPNAYKEIRSFNNDMQLNFNPKVFLKTVPDIADFSEQHFSNSILLKELKNTNSLRKDVKADDFSPGKQSILSPDIQKTSSFNDDISKDESLTRLKYLKDEPGSFHIISVFSAQPDPKSLFLHNLFGITYPVEDSEANISASHVKIQHEDKTYNIIILDPWRLIAENDKAKDLRRQLLAFGLNVSHITLIHKNPDVTQIGEEIEEALLCNQQNIIVNSQVYLLDFKLKKSGIPESILFGSSDEPKKDFWEGYISQIKRWSDESFDKIKPMHLEVTEKDEILNIRTELLKVLEKVNSDVTFKEFMTICDASWQDVNNKKDRLKNSKEGIIQAYEQRAKEDFFRKVQKYKANTATPSPQDDVFFARILGEAIDVVKSKFPSRKTDFKELEKDFRKEMFEHYGNLKIERIARMKQDLIEDLKQEMKVSLTTNKSFDSKKLTQKLGEFIKAVNQTSYDRSDDIIKYVKYSFEYEIMKKNYKVKIANFNPKGVPKVKPEWIKDFSCDCDAEDVTGYLKKYSEAFKMPTQDIINDAYNVYVDSFFNRDKLLYDLNKQSEIPKDFEQMLRRSVITEIVVTKLYNFEILQAIEKTIVIKEDEEEYQKLGHKAYDISFCKSHGNRIYEYIMEYQTFLTELWQDELCKKISKNTKEIETKIEKLRGAFKTITSREFTLEDLANHYKKFNLDPKIFNEPEFKSKLKDKNFKLEKESFDAKVDDTFVLNTEELEKSVKELMKKRNFKADIQNTICLSQCQFCHHYCFLKKNHSSEHLTYHIIYDPRERAVSDEIVFNKCIHEFNLNNWDKAGNTETNIKQQKEGFIKFEAVESGFLD